MQRIKVIGLALMAVFGLSAMLASSAMAEGPLWLVEHRECKEQSLNAVFATQLDCENNENRGSFSPGWEYTGTVLDHLLQKNEMADAKVTNLGVFKLESVINIECQKLSSPTLLLGGTPGKSDTTILFRECKVEGHPECDANSKGETSEPGGVGGMITVKAKDELVYTGTKTEAEKEEGPLGDLFTAEGAGPFVTIEFQELKAKACPILAKKTEVKGTVIGEVTPVEEMKKIGQLIFPAAVIEKAFVWEGKGKVKEVKSELTAFGLPSAQVGVADVELLSGLLWGVHRK